MSVTKSSCPFGGETLRNGNCTNPDPKDGLPVQCVGEWAEEKHYYLRQYIAATRAVRADYLSPKGSGGAGFVDLFAGPGRARLRDTGETVDGSPLIAHSHAEAPFTKLVLCDIDSDNLAALSTRTGAPSSTVQVVSGDCNERIADVVRALPEHGLNMAFVDPYGLRALRFATLSALAVLRRMDLIVHFPTGELKRNLFQHAGTAAWLDDALGTTTWRAKVTSVDEVPKLFEVLREQLTVLGYGGSDVRSIPIRNKQNLTLYYLVFASKHPLGESIWQSITRNAPSGQRGFPWA